MRDCCGDVCRSEVMDQREAYIHIRSNKLYITGLSSTPFSGWIVCGPVWVSERDDPNLSSIVLNALSQSKHLDATGKEALALVSKEILAAAKVKSWKAFSRNSKYVYVSDNGGVLTLAPSLADPTFETIGKNFIEGSLDADTLPELLIRAIDLAE